MPAPETPRPLTIGAALRWGAGVLGSGPGAMLDARVLLKAATQRDDARLVLDEAELLAGAARETFMAMIARRAAHEPVAYITGVREFWSLPIAVEPGILVPRADSETLIAAILARRDATAPWRILDLGCGSGALLCAVLASMPAATGLGVDISERAVLATNRNIDALGLGARGAARHSDWTSSLDGRFDVIVSNPPYVAEADCETLPPDVRFFEDPRALFGGPDGFDAYRSLSRLLPPVAGPASLIVLELGAGQAGFVRSLLQTAFPGASFELQRDFCGIDRALIIDLAKGPR